jgi:membrane fusion protein, copper/silver efflux system
MKKNSIVKTIFVFFFLMTLLTSCKDKEKSVTQADAAVKAEYTCPMHSHVNSDKPGKCPVCHMDLVPKDSNNEVQVDSSLAALSKSVNAHIVSSIPFISAETGSRIFSVEVPGVVTYDTRNQVNISTRIGGRIERLLIKYNYQPVRKGQLLMEVYSPDLAAAQRELIYLSKINDAGMLARAKQRVALLGMLPAQIEQVIRTGNVLYRFPVYSNTTGYILEKNTNTAVSVAPTASGSSSSGSDDGMNDMSGGSSASASASNVPAVPSTSPVLIREGQYLSAGQSMFTVYQNTALVADFSLLPQLMSKVKKGQRVLYQDASDNSKMVTGSIALVEPSFKDGTNFTVARVYITDPAFHPGQFLTAHIPVVYPSGWWLPRSAVLELGNKTIVFRKEAGSYTPVAVTTGVKGKDLVQIITNVQGWEIASKAAFLVDSESFITIRDKTQ